VTDPLDTEIRRLMGELSQRAPLAPTTEELGRRPQHRRQRAHGARAVALAALLMTVVGVATLRLSDDGSSTRVATGTVPSSQAAGGQGGLPPDVALPDPTFLTIATPPEGLRYIEGASRATGGRSDEIALADASGRTVRMLWNTAGGCAAGTPRTTVRGATEAPAEGAPPALRSDDAPFVRSADGGALRWCHEGRVEVNLIATGFAEEATRSLARTVQLDPGSPDKLVIAVPPGFVAGRPNAQGRLHRLAFRPDQAASSRPQLTVTVTSAWTTDLRLLGARLGPSASEVVVGDRRALVTEAPGGADFQWLILVYDDRTVVMLQGAGLTREQLVSAAASLRVADPSLAPDVAGDPSRCARLGLCG
jgi:hypothetical protein